MAWRGWSAMVGMNRVMAKPWRLARSLASSAKGIRWPKPGLQSMTMWLDIAGWSNQNGVFFSLSLSLSLSQVGL